jgi:16S rRNA A1518/A1519 N6-dimethyltransferase RsmA/KsgA/DIM1 with predicted DNA glycosylase/AP lyase activity
MNTNLYSLANMNSQKINCLKEEQMLHMVAKASRGERKTISNAFKASFLNLTKNWKDQQEPCCVCES